MYSPHHCQRRSLKKYYYTAEFFHYRLPPFQLAKDFERVFKDGQHSDFTIICRTEKECKEIPVHKIILVARSPVFKAMLESHTEEAKNNKVIYEDIDYDIMHEMLHYMYSGQSPNLQSMALDLLAVADRFQLNGLKEMADQVLRTGLAADSVCQNLVYADMHNATDLRNDAIRFIAQNSSAVLATDGWKNLVQKHSQLVTDIVAAMSQEQQKTSSYPGTPEQPLAKRGRFD
jgi:hypothetical protein